MWCVFSGAPATTLVTGGALFAERRVKEVGKKDVENKETKKREKRPLNAWAGKAHEPPGTSPTNKYLNGTNKKPFADECCIILWF